MMPSRRQALILGGGLGATFLTRRHPGAATIAEIEMRGTARGERIWYSPSGLAIAPGTAVRFVNRDPGNSHTATAYHPDNYGRLRRIPAAAAAWDSGFLLPNESFEVTLSAPGVYDYYCIPHEMAGMAGRIVVGIPGDPGWEGPAAADGISAVVEERLPSVESILAGGRIEEVGAR